jgi:phage terminase large subunit-like protein
MPNTLSAKRPLSEDEQKLLIVGLRELQARGIDVSKEANAILKKEKIIWPLGSNGYFIKNDGKLYEPSEAQEGFIKSTSRMVLFYGSRGSGKSGAGSQKALFKIMQGQSGSIMNPDFQNFKYSTWPEFKSWLPWNLVVASQRHRQSDAWEPHEPFAMVFTNGAKVYCKGLKDPDSARGPNINWLWYDEAGRDETGLGWKIAIASVRVGENPQAWATATPKPLDHWMYQFFIEKNIPKEAIEAFELSGNDDKILVESFHGTINENKDHLDAGFYASVLASYPSGWLRTQEVDGEFANEGGKIGDRAWFSGKILDDAPANPIKKVRFWDLAGTEKKSAKDDPDEAVGSLISEFETDNKKKNWCIEDQVSGQWAWEKLLSNIADTARRDGPYIPVVLEEEPGSGGKNQVAAVSDYFKRFPELATHKIIGQRARDVGDRVMAANHWFALAAKGQMWMVKGSWNNIFLSQLDGFTQVAHDDHITSVTGGMHYLSPYQVWKKIAFLTI